MQNVIIRTSGFGNNNSVLVSWTGEAGSSKYAALIENLSRQATSRGFPCERLADEGNETGRFKISGLPGLNEGHFKTVRAHAKFFGNIMAFTQGVSMTVAEAKETVSGLLRLRDRFCCFVM